MPERVKLLAEAEGDSGDGVPEGLRVIVLEWETLAVRLSENVGVWAFDTERDGDGIRVWLSV